VDLLETGSGRTGLTVRTVEPVAGGVEVIAGLQYPDTEGRTREGTAKLYLPVLLASQPGARLPLVHNAGYELDRAGGEALLKSGVIAATPCGEEPNPLARGENLDVAILHRVRALLCVDDARVVVMGGSAGGYMTLMLAAETFPLIAALPDVPPVNVGYNCAYIIANKPLAEAQPEGQDHTNMPILLIVSEIGEGATALLGPDYASRTWLNASPVVRMQEITCPTLITVSTADMLVPINQYSNALVRPFPPAAFPEGFTLDMDRLLDRPEARLKLLDAVPADEIEVFTVPTPSNAPMMGWDGAPESPDAAEVQIPFSRERRFSLAVIDEGPVEPQVGHFKRFIGLNKDAFRSWAEARPLGPEQLTGAKLNRLVLRYLGREAYPQSVTRDGGEIILNRLDFPEAERADVVRSLKTFCLGAGCAERLEELCQALPEELRGPAAEIVDGLC
jgi:hypothetical protein